MTKLQSMQEFLTATRMQIPIISFFVNLILAGILSHMLAWVYERYGNSLSNRKLLAKNFFLISMTTMLVISIVKSSLALSLGLVGALSIVRFRAAIKEPEELSYLFLAIAIGLGLGADQGIITIIMLIVLFSIIVLKKKISKRKPDNQNLILTINSSLPEKIKLEKVIDVLKTYCTGVNLKRFDETPEILEASFQVEFNNFDQLNGARSGLQKLSKNVKITFLDNKGLI